MPFRKLHSIFNRLTNTHPPPPATPATAEATTLTTLLWRTFWSPQHTHFTTPRSTAETIDSYHGALLWPFTLATQSLADAPSPPLPHVTTALTALSVFRSPELGAYCAWRYSPGNTDIYYDDNAQVAAAFLSGGEEGWRRKAEEVVAFLRTGEAEGGGVVWHVEKRVVNAVSCNLSAVVAARVGEVEFAERVMRYVLRELVNSKGLVRDSVGEATTWTYNTGAAITACCLLGWEAEAEGLVRAAVDREGGLFDLSIEKVEARYWWDSGYFLHLLIEGLWHFYEKYGAAKPELADVVKGEVLRHGKYMMTYMRDEEDGLYYRNLRLYRISQDRWERFRVDAGLKEKSLDLDPDERLQDPESKMKPVVERELCKTILGCAGAARSLDFIAKFEGT